MVRRFDSGLVGGVDAADDVKAVESALKKVEWLESAAKVFAPELVHLSDGSRV